jgi:hypothetical protein
VGVACCYDERYACDDALDRCQIDVRGVSEDEWAYRPLLKQLTIARSFGPA